MGPREKQPFAEDEIGLNCLGTVEILICSPRLLDQCLICPERQQLNKVYYKRNENTTPNGELLDNHDFRCRECAGVGGGAEGLWAAFRGRLRDRISIPESGSESASAPGSASVTVSGAAAASVVRGAVGQRYRPSGAVTGFRPRTRPTAPANGPGPGQPTGSPPRTPGTDC